LTFPRALIGGGAGGSKNREPRETLGAHAEKAARAERSATKLAVTATPTFATTIAPTPSVGAPTLAPAPAAPSNGNNKKLASLPRPVAGTPSSTSKPVVTASASHQASSAPKLAGAGGAAKPATVAAAKSSASAPAKPNAAGVTPTEKAKGRFLLQLSSFQDKAEADAFARRFASQNAYVVASEVPGKGTWYRVRVGSYVNLQEATAAKSAFEREHSVIAYVAGNGPVR
jgi:DedD protein